MKKQPLPKAQQGLIKSLRPNMPSWMQGNQPVSTQVSINKPLPLDIRLQDRLISKINPQLKQGKKDGEDKKAEVIRRNIAYKQAHPYAAIDEHGVLSTVDPDRDMEGLPISPNAKRFDKGLDHIMTGIDAAGYIIGAGELASAAGKAIVKSGILDNAYKLNPYRFKPNPEAFYRQIGDGADALESGVIRSADQSMYPRPNFVEGKDFNKLNSTGSGATNKNNMIAEMPMVKNGEMTAWQTQANSTYSPYQANLTEVPLSDVKLYQKDWLKGYKEIKVPSKVEDVWWNGKGYQNTPPATQEVISRSSGMDAVNAKTPRYDSQLFKKQGYTPPTEDPALMGTLNSEKNWSMEELPGLHLKSTMEGQAVSKIVESKTGLINVEQALSIIGKESGGADKVKLVREALGDSVPLKMDYNQFRKTVQDKLIPLERQFTEHSSNYGVGRLGYPSPKRSSYERAIGHNQNMIKRYEQKIVSGSNDVSLKGDLQNAINNLENSKRELATLPIENQTLLLSNKSKFGRGSNAHSNPEETLGHIHFLRDAETPDVLTVTQLQSDAFQGTNRIMPKVFDKEKELSGLAIMEKQRKALLKANAPEAAIEQEKYNLMLRNEIENFPQKQLLDKNHQERYLQELVDYAGKRGDLNKVRVPTSETAVKVQNYTPSITSENLDPIAKIAIDDSKTFDDFIKKVRDEDANRILSDTDLNFLKKVYDGQKSKNPFTVFPPEHETILKKYSEQPKTIKKLFGKEPTVVTDSKSNTWYEFDIPDKFKKGKGEIKAFGLAPIIIGAGAAALNKKQGGTMKTYQMGGPYMMQSAQNKLPSTQEWTNDLINTQNNPYIKFPTYDDSGMMPVEDNPLIKFPPYPGGIDPGETPPPEDEPKKSPYLAPIKKVDEHIKPKEKVDPFFAMRGFATGASWLSGIVDRNRQNQYMYNQYSTLGQNTPTNVNDYQPNPYNLYAQKGGSIKQYYQDYMNSPMYNKMSGDTEIDTKRKNQLDKFPEVNYVPNEFFGNAPNGSIAAGMWDKTSNKMNINDKLPKSRVPSIVAHEGSHQIDNGGELIPQKDIDFMKSSVKPGVPDNEFFNYLKQPTEVRARLNQIRFLGKQESTYNPYEEEFKPEYLNKFKDKREMQDLRKIYSDEQITELMNSVSQNGQSNIPIAQKGGLTPIITHDPKDPRIKNYQDSLILSNNTIPTEVKKYGLTYKGLDNTQNLKEFKSKSGNLPLSIQHWSRPIPKNIGDTGAVDVWQGNFKKPVQPVVYQKEPTLQRLRYDPQMEGYASPQDVNINIKGQIIPQAENNYRVEYQDENGNETHKMFPNEKVGSDFQKLLSGNRKGYYEKKKGGQSNIPIAQEGGTSDVGYGKRCAIGSNADNGNCKPGKNQKNFDPDKEKRENAWQLAKAQMEAKGINQDSYNVLYTDSLRLTNQMTNSANIPYFNPTTGVLNPEHNKGLFPSNLKYWNQVPGTTMGSMFSIPFMADHINQEPGGIKAYKKLTKEDFPYAASPFRRKMQVGGLTPIAVNNPTTRDSSVLHAHQVNLNKFYDNEIKNGRLKKTATYNINSSPKDFNKIVDILDSENLNFYRSQIEQRKKLPVYDDEYKKSFNLSSDQVRNLEFKGLGQTKAGNEYQKYYRDIITPQQNLAAPFAVVDKRILPDTEVSYDSLQSNYPGGVVSVYGYDPLRIKPWGESTLEERAEKIKRGFVKLNKNSISQTSMPIPKPEPQLKRLPYNPEMQEYAQPTQAPAIGGFNKIPEAEDVYNVQYTDPITGKRASKNFINEKLGSQFQSLLDGDREGRYLQKQQKGGKMKRTKTYLLK